MFKGVFLDGKIVNSVTGGQTFLRLIGDNPSIPYMQSATIALKLGANLGLTVSLVPNYADALELLSESNEWLRLGNTMGLRWGYTDVPGMISDWYYGFMQVPSVSYGEEISIDITANSLIGNMGKVDRVRVWSTTEKKLSFYEIATEIVKKYGLKLISYVSKEVDKAIREPRPDYIQGSRTDLQFLVFVGEALGARLIQQNDKILLIDKDVPAQELISNATFRMYGKIDVVRNIFPMLSFSPESFGTMFIQNHQGLVAWAYGPNDDTKKDVEPVVSTTTDPDSKVAPGYTAKGTLNAPTKDGSPPPGLKGSDGKDITAKSTVMVEYSKGEAGRNFSLPLDGDEPKEYIKSTLASVRENNSSDQGIKVNWSSIGLPNFIPGMFAKLVGVGDYFDGNYMTYEVTYNISSSGVEMNCVGQGRGFPAISEALDASYAALESVTPIEEGDTSSEEVEGESAD